MVTSGDSYELEMFVGDVLSNRFPTEPERQRPVIIDNAIKIACPYCGDSQRNTNEKRGRLYFNTKRYKCFNGGCKMNSAFATWREFIAYWSGVYKLDISYLTIDFEPDIDTSAARIEVKRGNTIASELRESGYLSELPDLDYFKGRFGLRPLSESVPGTLAGDAARRRMFLDIPGIDDFAFFDYSMSRIYVFNYDLVTNKVLGFSIRNLDEKLAIKQKYDTFTYSRMKDRLGWTDYIPEPEVLDAFGNYFNILNVDFTSPVTVLEGQFDALFVDNSMALSGLSKLSFVLHYMDLSTCRFLFDNDPTGKSTALKTIQDGYNTFLWSKLMSKLKKKFYMDKSQLLRVKDVNDLYMFLKGKGDFSKRVFNDFLDRQFSAEPMDMLQV